VETIILHHPEASELLDSNYISSPDPTGHELDAFTAPESDTEIPDDSTSSLPGSHEHYPRAGEAIGDVNGFEQQNSNLYEDLWAPLSCAQGFNRASWFIPSKVPKSRINEYFSGGLGSSVLVGHSSMHTLENQLLSLDPHSSCLPWVEGPVEDSKRTLPFFYRNVLDCVRYLLHQIAYQDDLVYAPRREFHPNGERIYAEMHTADWWWDIKYSALISFMVTFTD